MLWKNVKYAVWQTCSSAIGELHASLHPEQCILEETHSRCGWWNPVDLLRGKIFHPSSAHRCSSPWISHMKDSLRTAVSMICVFPMPSGFVLNNQVQQSIAIRYACSKMSIDFDGFVACMIRLETLFSKCLCLWVKGNSWKCWGVIKYLVSFNCECSRLLGNGRVSSKTCLFEKSEEE